ncbi:hypothetical protein OXX59_009262 [Metschnikowia pulcherrima]
MTKPFSGLNFCCTGLGSSHRQQLERQIGALGGVLHVDLMSSVNYLIVGGRKTEKYKYSVRYRHDIAFVSPAAITDLHGRWVAGDDADLDINDHLLPVFSNFTVCVARVEPPSPENMSRLFAERFRTPPAQALPPVMPKDTFSAENLIETMQKLGADVSATLTSDCSVFVGTDTAGKRFKMARQWQVPVVHPLWVYDSCLRGAALHLDDYELTDQFNLYSSTSFTWKNLYLARLRPSSDKAAKLAPEKRDRALLRKSSAVWTSIMSSTHQPAKQVRESAWEDSSEGATRQETSPLKLVNTDSLAPPSSARQSTLFEGFTFWPVGLSVPEQKLLRKVVESHSGAVASAAEDSRVTHVLLLVRDGPQAHLMLSMLPNVMKRKINRKEVAVVTDWFVERSVFYNEVRQDAWCRPMDGIVPSLSRFRVCVSGFTGVELLHIEKLIGLLHLEYCDVFNAKRDLLIVNVNLFKKSLQANSPQLFDYKHQEILACPIHKHGADSRSVAAMSAKNKVNAAKKWQIPVVSVAYLWEMVEISGGQPNLQLPDIFDRAWCIYAPKSSSRSSLMDSIKAQKEIEQDSKENQEKDSETQDEDRVQLPSPRKSKDKHKYGRLVGGGESLTEKLLKSKEQGVPESDPRNGEPDISIEDENLTQVGYGSADSEKGVDELWKKLEDINDRLPKRRRTRG